MPTDPAALIRFDWRVRRAEFVRTFAQWSDRAWLLFGLSVAAAALLSVRAAAFPFDDRIVAAALAGMTGFAVARAIHARLVVLAEESAMAVSALDPHSRRAYEAVCLASALIAVFFFTLLARSAVVGVGAAGFLAGALAVRAMRPIGASPARPSLLQRIDQVRRALARRGPAGGVAAVFVLLFLAPGPGWCVAALLIAGLVLTPMDADAVRFEAEAGLSTGRSLDRHLRAAGVLLVTVPGAAALVSPAAAPALALTAAALFALSAVRLLLYRTRTKRGADLMLGLGLGVVVLLATTVPPLAVVLVVVALVRLSKVSEAVRWRLAA